MDIFDARSEYDKAHRQATREYRRCAASGSSGYIAVLDDVLSGKATGSEVSLGLMEIPADLIVGTKTAGRQFSFSCGFMPLLGMDTEFANKWISLCGAHLSEGIHTPIQVYEYYGRFYVSEGNKRVSVLKYFGSPTIPGSVKRILPVDDGSEEYALYCEFLSFYKLTHTYDLQFTRPGSYAKLIQLLGITAERWSEQKRGVLYCFNRFRALLPGQVFLGDLSVADVFLLFLRYHDISELREENDADLSRFIAELQSDVLLAGSPDPVSIIGTTPDTKVPVLTKLFSGLSSRRLNVAFVHEGDPKESPWTRAHEAGREYIQDVLGDHVQTRAYFCPTPGREAEEQIAQAARDGADVVFTTSPPLIGAALRGAKKHPDIRMFNCSIDMPYPDVRTYYARVYEGKFITGAIAGAMAENGRIGYVGSYPIFGVPASINAFALGARMVRPDVRISLEWSCVRNDYLQSFFDRGIRIVSNRDVSLSLNRGLEYGTFRMERDGSLSQLASPVWNWGRLYENIARSMLDSTWDDKRLAEGGHAVNYWWGMKDGVIDVLLSDDLPDGVRQLAMILRRDIQSGGLSPFSIPLRDQSGALRCSEDDPLPMDEILRMDYLADCVDGAIPGFDEILPMARRMVRLQGVYRDTLPPEDEGVLL